MKTTLIILTSIAAAFALPIEQATAPQCEFSAFEKFNLAHNHDVNTGSILIGGTIRKGAPALLGSGCSPAWAVGGAITDKTPTKAPSGGASLFGGGYFGGSAAGGHSHGSR